MRATYPVNESVIQGEESARRENQRVLYQLQREVAYLRRDRNSRSSPSREEEYIV